MLSLSLNQSHTRCKCYWIPNLPAQGRREAVFTNCRDQPSWLRAPIWSHSLANQAMHISRYHIANYNEYSYNKVASLKRFHLRPRLLEFYWRVKSSRWSSFQRSESYYSCFCEISDDCQSSLQSPWCWGLKSLSTWCVILALNGGSTQRFCNCWLL